MQVLTQFAPLFENKFTYYVFYGGRGGGKSESIAAILVVLATQQHHRILCIRETQNSIADSVKALIEKWINELDLNHLFEITRDEIRCPSTGSVFLFKGMKSSNAVNIKSIAGITITWIEEAEAFSKRSWTLLVPSVTRVPNPKIIASFNPAFEDDVIYDTFIAKTPPPDSYVCKLNYYDNPFFASTNLEIQRKHDEATLPSSEYAHKWLGELQSYSEEALWNLDTIQAMRCSDEFARENYVKVVVACDPATTHNEFSNEYGVMTLGLRANGQIDLINDASGVYTPLEFANTVNQQYVTYEADCCVAEENQGGEFIRQTLLTANPLINYQGVWSSHDKIQRALPVASLGALGRIKHIEGGSPTLERQMRLMTSRGYLGPKGSSPDRVDAYVHGVAHLAGLKQGDTLNTFFDMSKFEVDKQFNFVELKNQLIVAITGQEASMIVFDVMSNSSLQRKIHIRESYIKSPSEILRFIEARADTHYSYIPEIPVTNNWNVKNAVYYEVDSNDTDELALTCLGATSEGKIQIGKLNVTKFDNESGELLKLRLSKYKPDSDKKDSMINCLCYLIKNCV